MELKNKIRFVHHNPEFGTKFTIAYHRDENSVVFAWTELYHTDEYVKSVGRQVATERLLKAIAGGFGDDVFGSEPLPVNLKQICTGVYIHRPIQVGILLPYYFKDAISHVIADTLLAKMNLMDFKHSAVSNALRYVVCDDQINPAQY